MGTTYMEGPLMDKQKSLRLILKKQSRTKVKVELSKEVWSKMTQTYKLLRSICLKECFRTTRTTT